MGGITPKPLQRAALHHRAGQRMADHVLGEPRAFDERLEIDSGRDPHLVAHEDEILGADIAGGALVAGEGQPPSPATELSKSRTPISSPA